jgi:hypothetical protein
MAAWATFRRWFVMPMWRILARGLGLQRRGEGAVRVGDVRHLDRIVKLEEIDIVRFQTPEALIDVG